MGLVDNFVTMAAMLFVGIVVSVTLGVIIGIVISPIGGIIATVVIFIMFAIATVKMLQEGDRLDK